MSFAIRCRRHGLDGGSCWERARCLAQPAALYACARRSAASLTTPIAVFPPPGYDFASAPRSIREEWGNLEDFYQSYFNGMRGAPASDAYGLALANQIIGLLRNDPAYILRASALFAMHRDATKNAKERHLADLGAKYNGYLLTGNYPKAERPPRAPRQSTT